MPGDLQKATDMETWHAVVIGLVEGITEYIPVSSTAHILLAERLFGVTSSNGAFEVLIQLGAILALLTVYAAKLWNLLLSLPSDVRTQKFAAAVLLAFLPAAVLGFAFHKFITHTLFGSPLLICAALIFGGIVLLLIDRMKYTPKFTDVMDVTPATALKIGLFQCLSLIPGMSRSGSTIVGAMLLGVDKRTAAEFSFFLAIPTMVGAFTYDLYKNWADLSANDMTNIAIGFVVAFISGVYVVRTLLEFISTRGLSFFGWWRILVGGIGLGAIVVLGA
jgi:undecaprenyl-diphosphatase